MKRLSFFLCLFTLTIPFLNNSFAASESDIDTMTTYSIILGRSIACGIDTNSEVNRVSKWMDKTFTGKERSMYILIFSEGMKMSAQAQAEGRSPDTCSTVRREFEKMPWP